MYDRLTSIGNNEILNCIIIFVAVIMIVVPAFVASVFKEIK